jgi:hypothetical protein
MMVPPAPSFSFRVFSCQPPSQASRVRLASDLVKTSVLPSRRRRVAYQDRPVSTSTTASSPPTSPSPFSSSNQPTSLYHQPTLFSQRPAKCGAAFGGVSLSCGACQRLVFALSTSLSYSSLFDPLHHHRRQPAFFLPSPSSPSPSSSAEAALARGLLVCLSSFVQECLSLYVSLYFFLGRPPSHGAYGGGHLLLPSGSNACWW